MKTEKNILVAFLLNLSFSVLEFLGGIFTGSVAIVSDAIHDLGDATSIGISFFLEKKSKKDPDTKYTYGYTRYSVIGSIITCLVLFVGSALVIVNAVYRLFFPTEVNYAGMIYFAIFGVVVNFIAAWFTREGDSLNQKAVNLHMLEDVLGWVVVLSGAIIMKFTDIAIIDSLMSIGVAIFILISAFKTLKEAMDLILEKAPEKISVNEIEHHVSEIEGVSDVHHIHIWSTDGVNIYATMHVVSDESPSVLKPKIREELREHGIGHVTIEFETSEEQCMDDHCHIEHDTSEEHHHH